jgi:hypothetical protein
MSTTVAMAFFFLWILCSPNNILEQDPRCCYFLTGARQSCGSGMFPPGPGSDFFPSQIPDPTFVPSGSLIRIFSHPGSRIRIKKNLSILTPKKLFLSSHPGSGFCFFTHPESRLQGLKRHRIPYSDPQHWVPGFSTNQELFVRAWSGTFRFQWHSHTDEEFCESMTFWCGSGSADPCL